MASDVKHDYHLVNPSPWPFVGSLGAFVAAVGAVLWMNKSYDFGGLQGQPWVMSLGLAMIAYTMYGWWRDVTRESLGGDHTPVVKLHLRYGMVLFIASEVMFFVAWFWAFFNVALYPEAHHMTTWPPEGIVTFDPWHLPLINTVVLLTSGMTVTWAHHAATEGDTPQVVQGLFLTVLLGVLFTALQAYEYSHAAFTFGFQGAELQPLEGAALEVLANPVGDVTAIYGSTFYMATGFHGFHVVIGTIFLAVCLFRAMRNHFTAQSHFGLEAAAWYWHFVDVVWLFLFAAIYVWAAGPHAGGAH